VRIVGAPLASRRNEVIRGGPFATDVSNIEECSTLAELIPSSSCRAFLDRTSEGARPHIAIVDVGTRRPDALAPRAQSVLTTSGSKAYNCSIEMSSLPDNLATLKDDMVAFIEGHGMRRFPGYVDHEEVQTVVWKPGDDSESWKDFVEMAKAAGSPFVIMDSWQLEKQELEGIIQRLSSAEFSSDEDLEDARWLRTYLGKTGFVQVGFAFQGVMMLYEASTEWYEHYQRLVEVSEDFGGLAIDDTGTDDEP